MLVLVLLLVLVLMLVLIKGPFIVDCSFCYILWYRLNPFDSVGTQVATAMLVLARAWVQLQ